MRAISLDAFGRNQAGQRDWGNAIMSPQTSQMMGNEQENLLKKYTTCSNTPEITVTVTPTRSSKMVSNATGKPKYACKACGRQFVDAPAWRVISDEINGIIDRLLHERISLAGIARAVQVSESWLQVYVNENYRHVPREVRVRSKKGPIDYRVRRIVVVCRQ